MSGSAQAANIELDTQSVFERRWHIFEIGCWVVMAAVVLAAVAGILGKGPLAEAKASSAGNEASVTYQRFSHYMAPGRYEIAFGPLGSTIRVHVDRGLLSKADIMGVNPRPLSAADDGTGWNYVFAASDAAGQVEFRLQPRGLGAVEGDLTVNGSAVHIKQFILP